MYKEFRATERETASTAEMWAENFSGSGRLSLYHRAVFRMDHRWGMIRRAIMSGGRILDAGSGAGEWVAFLNERGYLAEGLDYSPELIARTKAMYPTYTWTVGSIQHLPYADATFDGVISWGVIEHTEDGPDRALAEFYRVLKPGGAAIVTVPVDTERQRRASQAVFPPDVIAGAPHAFFQYFFTTPELESRVRSAGFETVDRGLQGAVSGQLLAPEFAASVSATSRHLLNKIVRVSCWWNSRLKNMTYCVGRRP